MPFPVLVTTDRAEGLFFARGASGRTSTGRKGVFCCLLPRLLFGLLYIKCDVTHCPKGTLGFEGRGTQASRAGECIPRSLREKCGEKRVLPVDISFLLLCCNYSYIGRDSLSFAVCNKHSSSSRQQQCFQFLSLMTCCLCYTLLPVL